MATRPGAGSRTLEELLIEPDRERLAEHAYRCTTVRDGLTA